MRLAIVQFRPGLPTAEEQAARLRALSPDDYHLEAPVTAKSPQRLLERLERLESGDCVLLMSLAVLAPSLPEVLRLLAELLRRSVVVQAFDGDGRVFEIAPDSPAAAPLLALAELGRTSPSPRGRARTEPTLLSEADKEEIRRLHRAGLSLRRIGLIFRRTPKAIAEVIWGYDPSDEGVVPTQRVR